MILTLAKTALFIRHAVAGMIATSATVALGAGLGAIVGAIVSITLNAILSVVNTILTTLPLSPLLMTIPAFIPAFIPVYILAGVCAFFALMFSFSTLFPNMMPIGPFEPIGEGEYFKNRTIGMRATRTLPSLNAFLTLLKDFCVRGPLILIPLALTGGSITAVAQLPADFTAYAIALLLVPSLLISLVTPWLMVARWLMTTLTFILGGFTAGLFFNAPLEGILGSLIFMEILYWSPFGRHLNALIFTQKNPRLFAYWAHAHHLLSTRNIQTLKPASQPLLSGTDPLFMGQAQSTYAILDSQEDMLLLGTMMAQTHVYTLATTDEQQAFMTPPNPTSAHEHIELEIFMSPYKKAIPFP